MEKRIYYLSNTVIPNTKREKNIHVFNVLTQVGVKQLTDFLRTVTAASDLVDCTLVNCDICNSELHDQMKKALTKTLTKRNLFTCCSLLLFRCFFQIVSAMLYITVLIHCTPRIQ